MHISYQFLPSCIIMICECLFIKQIDSLDTLALLGDKERFDAAVEWVGKNVRFDIVSKQFTIFFTNCID